MTEARVLAEVRDYDGLHAALRARAEAMNVPRSELDRVAGLADGHAGKLLSPVQMKALGPKTLGPMLTVLGLMLLVVEDAGRLAQITNSVLRTRHAGAGMQAQETRSRHKKSRRWRRRNKFTSEQGKVARAIQMLGQSTTVRRRLARKAARARWGKIKPDITKLTITDTPADVIGKVEKIE